MPTAKSQLRGQFAVHRSRAEPLSLQIVDQLQEAIETCRVTPGARLPSTRALARTLGVSRNTVLAAYEELVSRGLVRGRRGAGMYVLMPATVTGLDLQSFLRHAQYPARTIIIHDLDGNPIAVSD